LPLETLTADLGPAAALRDLVDRAAGVAMRARRLAFAQQLELRAYRRHDRPASERVAVLVDRVLLQRRVRFIPCVLELRRIGLAPVLARQLPGSLHYLRMHLVEVGVERVHQRDVEPVLPD